MAPKPLSSLREVKRCYTARAVTLHPSCARAMDSIVPKGNGSSIPRKQNRNLSVKPFDFFLRNLCPFHQLGCAVAAAEGAADIKDHFERAVFCGLKHCA